MALITCQDVSIAYDGKTVVSGLNFQVDAGDYLCIVGENGAGKSTLVKGMLGLLKPSGGSILAGDGLKQNEIGYLPQHSATFPQAYTRSCFQAASTAAATDLFLAKKQSGALWAAWKNCISPH